MFMDLLWMLWICLGLGPWGEGADSPIVYGFMDLHAFFLFYDKIKFFKYLNGAHF